MGALITLHTPLGREIYVNGGEVMLITPPTATAVRGCGAEVMVHDRVVCVWETPREVKNLVEAEK